MAYRFDDRFMRVVPPEVDLGEIRRQWRALAPPYDVHDWKMPLPIWAQGGNADSGDAAWRELQRDLETDDPDRHRPMCIYVHIPFCDSKCGFCDAYSFRLAPPQCDLMDRYVAALEQEMRAWARLEAVARRPVTTVHFGGGTPTFLGIERFSRVIATCSKHFRTTPATEWAVESTAAHLTPEMLDRLHDLGVRRLHVGVQTLEDGVRRHIGRRLPAAEVVARIEAAAARGWVVSADLLCGLPDETLEGFVDGIRRLLACGIHGFSLFELLVYPQNQRWAMRYGLLDQDHLSNYLMFQVGASYLEAAGFRKNLFNHWADERDRNLYFTFPTRGEDLLALGAIADGSFGDYHFRHPEYAPYVRQVSDAFPALENGLRANAFEQRLRPYSVALLAGELPLTLAARLDHDLPGEGASLLARWADRALVRAGESGGALGLTTNGTWFTGNMIDDVRRAYQATTGG